MQDVRQNEANLEGGRQQETTKLFKNEVFSPSSFCDYLAQTCFPLQVASALGRFDAAILWAAGVAAGQAVGRLDPSRARRLAPTGSRGARQPRAKR